jgi:6-phosphogluconolactonase
MAFSRSWTRRRFVQTVGSLSVLAGVAPVETWASAAGYGEHRFSIPRFAFVSSSEDAVHVFAIRRDGSWERIQKVSSLSPVSLVLSPDQRFLYVANAIKDFEHRPTGSVEAYALDVKTGHLRLLNRQGLALSATMPRHLAISPNARQLAVAVAGGAAYNLLPLNEDGSIGRVTASLKQVGRGFDSVTQPSASPHSVLFQCDATLLATDMGSDRVSSFSLAQDGSLAIEKHQGTTPGNGPGALVGHPGGKAFFVAGGLSPVISSFQYRKGLIIPLLTSHQFRLPDADGGISSLAMDCSGQLLFASSARNIWMVRIDGSGGIEGASGQVEAMDDVTALATSSDGTHLLASTVNGSLTRFEIDAARGKILTSREVASVAHPTAVALSTTKLPTR